MDELTNSGRALRGSALALGCAASGGCAALVLGALFPALPVAGPLGSLLVGRWGFEFAVVGTVLAVLTWAARGVLGRGTGSWAIATTAITLVGALVVLGTQLSYAHDHRTPLRLADVVGTEPGPAPPDRTVTFATVDGLPLRAGLWLPRTPGSHRPALVWVHGGGFTSGTLHEQPGIYRFLADHGYPVISVEYRLAPPVRWHDATSDVTCALSWITAHAAELGVDPARLVLSGGSAGGSLSLNVAYGLAERDVASSCGGPPPAVPVAVAGLYPASDLAGVYEDNQPNYYGKRTAEAYLGGSPAQFPERYAYASAATRVRPGLMPTLLITGADDHLIRAERVRDLAAHLRATGNEVTFDAFPFAEHAFDADYRSIGGAFSRWSLLDFLRRHAPA